MPQKERRKYPRAKVVWPVIIENNRRGAYIKCRSPLRHPEVNMFMSVSLLSSRVRAIGEVVRSDVLGSVKKDGCYGIGVRFVAISDTDRELISSKVAELLNHKTSEEILHFQ